MHTREHTIAMVRARRRMGIASRRRRLPQQQRPTAVAGAYYAAILAELQAARAFWERELFGQLPRLLELARAMRGDSVEVAEVLRVPARDAAKPDAAVGEHLERLLAAPVAGLLRDARADESAVAASSVMVAPRRAAVLVYPAAQLHAPILHLDASVSLKEEVEKAAKRFRDQQEADAERLETIARKAAENTARFQKVQLGRQVKAALGVDLDAVLRGEPSLEQRIRDFTAQNVSLIKSVSGEYAAEIEKDVLRAVTSGLRHEELAKELEAEYGYARKRAALIARDQVGKLFSQIDRSRQQAIGVDEYVWRTSQDERVRDEHRALDGQQFSYKKPPSEGHPGEAINCRCQAEPVFSGILGDILNGTAN